MRIALIITSLCITGLATAQVYNKVDGGIRSDGKVAAKVEFGYDTKYFSMGAGFTRTATDYVDKAEYAYSALGTRVPIGENFEFGLSWLCGFESWREEKIGENPIYSHWAQKSRIFNGGSAELIWKTMRKGHAYVGFYSMGKTNFYQLGIKTYLTKRE